MVAPDEIRWEGYSHSDIWHMVQQGSGAKATIETEGLIDQVSTGIANAGNLVNSALQKANAGWTGDASASASGAMSTLRDHGDVVHSDSVSVHTNTLSQSGHSSITRTSIPPVLTTTSILSAHPTSPEDVLAATTDQQGHESAAKQAEEHAREVMRGYGADTSSRMAALPKLSPAPKVTAEQSTTPSGSGSTVTKPLSQRHVPTAGSSTQDTTHVSHTGTAGPVRQTPVSTTTPSGVPAPSPTPTPTPTPVRAAPGTPAGPTPNNSPVSGAPWQQGTAGQPRAWSPNATGTPRGTSDEPGTGGPRNTTGNPRGTVGEPVGGPRGTTGEPTGGPRGTTGEPGVRTGDAPTENAARMSQLSAEERASGRGGGPGGMLGGGHGGDREDDGEHLNRYGLASSAHFEDDDEFLRDPTNRDRYIAPDVID